MNRISGVKNDKEKDWEVIYYLQYDLAHALYSNKTSHAKTEDLFLRKSGIPDQVHKSCIKL